MIEALERPDASPPVTDADERAARRTLAAQVERLERELADLLAAAWPRVDVELGAPGGRRVPHLLDLGELERVRDGLAARVEDVRRQLRERRRHEAERRRLAGAALRDPAAHRWAHVSHADIGEPGCRHLRVVPRWGPIGLLANWWRVKISSGCP